MPSLTYLLLLLVFGFFIGFTITWFFYDEDKPLGFIILNSNDK